MDGEGRAVGGGKFPILAFPFGAGPWDRHGVTSLFWQNIAKTRVAWATGAGLVGMAMVFVLGCGVPAACAADITWRLQTRDPATGAVRVRTETVKSGMPLSKHAGRVGSVLWPS